MIIALLALAVAMILGGLLTTLFGWDIVLVERGWTMVIAGSVTAASGAILLGIAAAVSEAVAHPVPAVAASGGNRTRGCRRRAAIRRGPVAGGGLRRRHCRSGSRRRRRTRSQGRSAARSSALHGRGAAEREEDEVQVAEWPEKPRVDEPILPFPPRTTPAPAPLREEDETDMKVPDFLLRSGIATP